MKYNLRRLMTFSLRDLFLVTVIVALGLGWWVRESQLAGELVRCRLWRNAAGALEAILKDDGAEVKWHFNSETPTVTCVLSGHKRIYFFSHRNYSLESYEPSNDVPEESETTLPNSSAPAPNQPKP